MRTSLHGFFVMAIALVGFLSAPARADILYASNFGDNTIEKFTAAGIGSTFVESGIIRPWGMAFDSAGNLYVSDSGNLRILKITPGGIVSVFANNSLTNTPRGLAFDQAGNLYFANQQSGLIVKVTPSGVSSVFGGGLFFPSDLAFDRAGNLYVGTTGGTHQIVKFPPAGASAPFLPVD